MPIYLYETLGERKRQFEVKQSMKEAALTVDPETGEPVRRVISGGYGLMQKGGVEGGSPGGASHGCGMGGCGCH